MRVAIVTYSLFPNLRPTDIGLISEFAQKNIFAQSVVWNNPTVDWSLYDYIIIRSSWDYYLNYPEFMAWLDTLEAANCKIINSAKTIRKNLQKFYLRDLQNSGVAIIPTIFVDKTENLDLRKYENKLWSKSIIKPAFSAASFMTKVFEKSELEQIQSEYKEIACERNLLLQPFMNEIVDFGEISMIFFNQKFSHSIVKKPKENDFRVQVNYGGKYTKYLPDNELIETAEKIVNTWGEKTLYARVDGVLHNGKFLLMELELIEPDLYFEFSENSHERFVESFIKYITK